MRKLMLILSLFMFLNVAWGFTPVVSPETSSSGKSVNNGEEHTKIIRGNFDLGADARSFTRNDMDSKVRSFLSKNILQFEIDPGNLALFSSSIAQKSKDLSILKYTQTHSGLPVYSSRVIAAVQDGKMVTLKSDYHPKIDISTKPALSVADTLEVVETDIGVPIKKSGLKLLETFDLKVVKNKKLENITKKNVAQEGTSVENILLVIYPEHTDLGIEYHLAYKIELGLIKSPLAKWTYIVDANNGEILEKYDRVVYSTLNGKATGSVYPESINQSPVTKNFSNLTLYNITSTSDVFWSGKGNNLYNYITTKTPINLSGVSSATLEFKTKYSMENGYDFGYATISTDNITYYWHEKYTGNLPDWSTREINLSDFVGQQIWIRFDYITDEYVQYDGMYIDDIKIETNTGTKFNETGNSFANWNNVGFSITTQNLGSYALGNTSSNGSYSLSGLPGSFVLHSELIGPYVEVSNFSGINEYLNIDIITPSTQNIDWGTYDTSYKIEASNVFYHVNRVHDFFVKGSPFDISSMNYQTTAYIQYVHYPDTCNAFADGTNIHFFGASVDCEATSLFSDVIYHEYTHNVVDHVYTTNLPYRGESGALNEGWADYFATSINGNPCMAEGFDGDCLRNLTDIYRYPEDIMGEVHDDSRIVAGASWDLKQALGADIADALVMNAIKLEPFNFSEYLEDIIVADDNNGNLADGTPHLFDICTVFYQKHGIYSNYCYTYYPVEPTVNLIKNPGFESGLVNWTNYSSDGHQVITNEYSDHTHQGSWFAYMGDYNNATDYIYQDITIPSDANEAYVRFWYWILSNEITTTTAYDRMKIEIKRPDDNTLLKYLGNLSNLNASSGFVISSQYNVSEFKGQTIRLMFNTTTDSGLVTAFLVDDTELMEVITVTPAPSIIGFGPSSLVGDTSGAARTFNITVNQTVNVTWTINGITRQTNMGVTAASYTNASAEAGTWNVIASATNDNGTAVQSWTWTVSATTIVVGNDTIGVYRNSSNVFYLRNNETSTTTIGYGSGSDIPVSGDWNGDDATELGVFRNINGGGVFFLRNNATSTTTIGYGSGSDTPVSGDWNGDHTRELGVFRNINDGGVFFLRNNATSTTTIGYGLGSDIPVTGDWDGDGTTDVGVFRNGVFFFRNNATSTTTIGYGLGSDIPVSGDWNGDGITTIGVYRNGVFYLRNETGVTTTIGYGISGDIPVVGNWNGH